MMIAALAEPAMLMVVLSLAILWGIDRFGTDRADPVERASGPTPN
jgi:hypothetical protein